jgi:hypothetical protein
MARSIVAVVVGYLLIGMLSFGADVVMHNLRPEVYLDGGRLEHVPTLLVVMVYVAVFAILGCYVTARLAPRNPMKHALILGALGVVTQVAMWSIAWNTVPAWFHIVSLALVMPYAWIGGRIREKQLERGGRATPRAATA